jgi:putative transcriptional regulator
LVTLGYAGWSAGQLEQEIAENSWLTTPADQEVLFNTQASDKFAAAGKLLGIDIHLLTQQAGHS